MIKNALKILRKTLKICLGIFIFVLDVISDSLEKNDAHRKEMAEQEKRLQDIILADSFKKPPYVD